MGTQKNRLDETSFAHPKHMFKLMGKKIITILRLKKLLYWPYAIPLFIHQIHSLTAIYMPHQAVKWSQLNLIKCYDRCKIVKARLFVYFDALHPSQHFFSHLGVISCSVLNQYSTVDKASCSNTQHIDSAGGESRTSNSLISSLTLYQLKHCYLCLSNRST